MKLPKQRERKSGRIAEYSEINFKLFDSERNIIKGIKGQIIIRQATKYCEKIYDETDSIQK